MGKGSGGATSGGTGKGRQRPRIDASGSEGQMSEGQLGERFANSLTPSQRTAVESYMGSNYKEMNDSLRGKTSSASDFTRDNITNLRSALDRSIGAELTLFRGIDAPSLVAAAKAGGIEGTVISDKGFVSTSLSSKISEDYLAGTGENGVLIRIRAGTDTKGAVLGPTSNKEEREVLLQAGSKIKITGAKFSTRDDAFSGEKSPMLVLDAVVF